MTITTAVTELSNAAQIQLLKTRLRAAILTYRSLSAHFDCGASFAAVFSSDVRAAAIHANRLAAKLKAIDPDFPSSWQPYPEEE